MNFEFATPGRILFGPGMLKEIGPIARSFGQNALVVTGRNAERAGGLIERLQSSAVRPVLFAVTGEPDVPTVEHGTRVARENGCELVIGFGGGSAIDAGKAISAMVTNPGNLLDYLEVIGAGKALPKPTAPFIAIPTTAGTGSEVTRNAVLGAPSHRVKVSLRSPFMLARVALVDPELTYGLPAAITASTGMDALTQLIEPYVSARANPMVDALCVKGIALAGRSLRRAYLNPGDAEARNDMSLASLFGGLALANAGLGAVHGFAGPIGGMFPAPHGAVCATLLPHVMAANLSALRARQRQGHTLKKYAEIASWLTGDPEAAPEQGVDWIQQLLVELKIPGLAKYGLSSADVPQVVEKARKASSMKANPIELTSAELAGALEKAL